MLPLFALMLLFAPADAAVPVEKEPRHHQVLANAYTRVYQVEVAPHDSTLLHEHKNDYVAVVLGPADLQNAVEGKPVTASKVTTGEVLFTRGGFAHRAINAGNTPFRNLTIEILKKKPASAKKQPPERGLEIGHGGMVDTVLDNEEVRVRDLQVAAGGMLHAERHPYPYLLVAVTDLALHNMAKGSAAMLHLKPGDVRWFPPGPGRETMNMAREAARFITVEFK